MDESFYIIVFLLVTLGLFVVEVFIPSGGIIAMFGIICLAISAWYAWSAWWVDNPIYWWSYVLAVLILVPTTVGGTFYILPHTTFGKKFMPDPPSLAEVTGHSKEEEKLNALVGKCGKTLSTLMPGGLVELDGERFHCESEGMVIETQETVEVIQIRGNRLVVRPVRGEAAVTEAESAQPESADSSNQPNEGQSDDESLDFDVPQNSA